MNKEHLFKLQTVWTGNRGTGTSNYTEYDRNYIVKIEHKNDLLCSSDPAFRGDKTLYNPEDFLISSLSACHMLWYLHLCADAGIIVVGYTDNASGILVQIEGKGGHFSQVTLHPIVTVAEESMLAMSKELHQKAHEKCFIANSVNFPVIIESSCRIINN